MHSVYRKSFNISPLSIEFYLSRNVDWTISIPLWIISFPVWIVSVPFTIMSVPFWITTEPQYITHFLKSSLLLLLLSLLHFYIISVFFISVLFLKYRGWIISLSFEFSQYLFELYPYLFPFYLSSFLLSSSFFWLPLVLSEFFLSLIARFKSHDFCDANMQILPFSPISNWSGQKYVRTFVRYALPLSINLSPKLIKLPDTNLPWKTASSGCAINKRDHTQSP